MTCRLGPYASRNKRLGIYCWVPEDTAGVDFGSTTTPMHLYPLYQGNKKISQPKSV